MSGNKSSSAEPLTFVVDLAVPINVCFSDHFVHFLVSQLLSQVCHHVTQLGGTNVAVAILTSAGQVSDVDTASGGGVGTRATSYLVKDTECFSNLLLAVRVLHLSGHHGQELWEVYRSIP